MNKLRCDIYNIPGFCAGQVLWNFLESYGETSSSAEEHLKFLFSRYKGSSGMLFMGDCEGGNADNLLFAPLITAEGTTGSFIHQEGELCYQISPYYFNKSSGNMCRHLTAWLELSEEAIQEWRNENEEQEPAYDECDCDKCQEARR